MDRSTRIQALWVGALMAAGALLEVVGIGLVFPLVKVIAEPDLLQRSEWAAMVFGPVTLENRQSVMILMAVGFIGVIVFKNAFLLLIYFVQGRFITRNQALLAKKLFDLYLHGDYRLHLLRNSANLINNVVSITGIIYSHALRGFMTLGIEVFLVAILTCVLVVVEPLITIGALTMILICVAIFYGTFKKRLAAWGKRSAVANQQILQILQQGLHNIKEVKVFGREDFVLNNFDEARQEFARVENHLYVASNAPRLWIETVVISIAMLGVIYIVAKGGDSSGFLSVMALFAAAAFRLIPSMNRILMAMSSIKRSDYAVDVISEDFQTFKGDSGGTSNDSDGKFEFRETLVLDDVSFTYPEAEGEAVSDISLTIKRGQSVGLVGPSGAGKTTLVDIILGLLPSDSGRILIDGRDIAGNIRGWQANLSYVPQFVYLMDDTLRRNIAFGIPDADISDDSVWNAVRLAQLEELVHDLADGLETKIGERGIRLSGGQRQRVAIARALYTNPEVLIFDEATSSLDSETEHEINKAIERLSGDKTVIIIAHRLSTVRTCDRLVFLEKGRIVDTGTFEDLTARNDAFRNLVELAAL